LSFSVAEPKNIRLPGVSEEYEDKHKDKGKLTVNVSGKAEAEVYNIEGYCTLKKAVPEPKTWQIDKTFKNNGENLFVFHLLPQNATRIYQDRDSGNKSTDDPPKMTDNPPKGVECKLLTIKFVSFQIFIPIILKN
jgi:hypothetical protein